MRAHVALTALGCALGVAVVAPLSAETLSAPDSTITAVTVFPDRAQVTRTVHLTLPAGAHTLLVADLPASLTTTSLRVAGESQNDLTISAVDLRREVLTLAASTRSRELEQQLNALHDEEAGLNAQQQALDAQAAFIKSLGQPTEHDGTPLDPKQWASAWQAIGQGMRDVGDAQVKLSRAQHDLTDRIRAVQEELDRLNQGERARYTAALSLAGHGGSATFTLTYQVPNARWAPVYDANLDSGGKTLHLVQGAYVQQQTGEDWSQVALTLATNRPSASSSAPQLSPWWIDFAQPQPPAPAPVMAMAEREDAYAERASQERTLMQREASAAKAKAATVATLQAVVSDFAAEYRVPGKVTLAATGDRQRYVLGEQQWPVELSLTAVPRLDLTAYLNARFTYDGKAPLLAGEWRLSRDGAFIGSRRQDQIAPGSHQDIAFGADDAVTLTYEPLLSETGTSGLISKQNTVKRHYRITAISGHSQPMPLTVEDQLPVAANDAIKVSLDKDGTAPSRTDIDDRKGIIAWDMTLKPKDKAQIDFRYDVTYPGERQLDGL